MTYGSHSERLETARAGIITAVDRALTLDTQISVCSEVEGARHLVPDLQAERQEVLDAFSTRQRNAYNLAARLNAEAI